MTSRVLGGMLVVAGLALAARASTGAPPPGVVVEVVAEGRSVFIESPDRTVSGALRAAGVAAVGEAAVAQGDRVVVERGEARVEAGAGELALGVPLDVNRASAAQLEALPGVGPALAGRVVRERERGGPFADVADLQRVHGVGPARIQALTGLVRAVPVP